VRALIARVPISLQADVFAHRDREAADRYGVEIFEIEEDTVI